MKSHLQDFIFQVRKVYQFHQKGEIKANAVFTDRGDTNSGSFPDKANKLFDDGHTITYWTARGCKSGKSAEYFSLTYDQLIKYGVKFHELRMGKPHFDLFIDDKNINALNGWTDENIEQILRFQKENDSKRVD